MNEEKYYLCETCVDLKNCIYLNHKKDCPILQQYYEQINDILIEDFMKGK